MASTSDLAQLRNHCADIIGREAWGAKLGVGSFITIDFGPRLFSPPPRSYAFGTWHIWVMHADWRIEDPSGVRAACEDSRDKMAAAIELLNGRVLQQIDVQSPSLDTVFTFEGGLLLRLFMIHSEEYEHWMLFTPGKMVVQVGPGSEWSYGSSL